MSAERRDYKGFVLPEAGGEVAVEVSGWGYWNVWVKSVDTPHLPETILQPGDAFRLAGQLLLAGACCWWRQLPDRLAGRLHRRGEVPR